MITDINPSGIPDGVFDAAIARISTKCPECGAAHKDAPDFITELRELINRRSMETGSDTPDFILAAYLTDCLLAWNRATKRREDWCGRTPREVPPTNSRDQRPGEGEAAVPNGGRCETCGTETIDHCPVCGAPQCCPSCCADAMTEGTRQDSDQAARSGLAHTHA